jgi:hypothetical protein
MQNINPLKEKDFQVKTLIDLEIKKEESFDSSL